MYEKFITTACLIFYVSLMSILGLILIFMLIPGWIAQGALWLEKRFRAS